MLDQERRSIMIRRGLGLTKLYNLVNDPAVTGDADMDRMREMHVEVDDAVVAAFSWTDVPSGHGHHVYRQVERWGPSPQARTELLDRLLLENHVRAAAPPTERRGTGAGTLPTLDTTLFD
jgi:hypothetical protein